MNATSNTAPKPATTAQRWLIGTIAAVLTAVMAASALICYQALMAEAHARYLGIRNVASEKVAKTIRGVEMSANNIFAEVEKNLQSPETVIAALEGKASLNLDVRGYFAAFTPNYFPEKGTWFEPYIYQPETGGFEYKQMGSARHNYTKSPWFIRAKKATGTFWSRPYYFYDGTTLSGHYFTFVKPIYDNDGKLACVCGADMKFGWLSKELEWVDDISKNNSLLNRYHPDSDYDFYSVIINNDGTCIAHPNDKALIVNDKEFLRDIALQKSGVIDMDVNGEACRIYYGPIEYIHWTAAIVVPKSSLYKPMLDTAVLLLIITTIGLLAVWLLTRKAFKNN